MKSREGQNEWHTWMIRAWHLAILRFAVTLDHADKLGVFAIAAEIDRLGGNCDEKRQFGFFRKTSAELCASMLRQNQTADTTFRRYLAGINDSRLKRALAAAIAMEQPDWRRLNRRLNGVPGRITIYGEGCLREAVFDIERRDLGRSYPGSLAEELFLERYPFRVGRDLHKRLVDRPFERTVLGERDCHIGRCKQPLRHFLRTPVTF